MKFKNQTKFHIKGLNQEKILNDLSKKVSLMEVKRNAKDDTTFKCSYFSYKKVEKYLKNKNVKIEDICHEGICYKIKKIAKCYGVLLAFLIFGIFYFLQSQFIAQFQILGVDKLSKTEIVSFVKDNFPKSKFKIDTKKVENSLIQNFDEISFVSCIIKGQTLVINIKEKLLPEQIYGQFQPLKASHDGKITSINLISGTCLVKVGDIVRAGDVLVEPYILDSSSNIKKVEAKAEIFADVYHVGRAQHFEHKIEIVRTGRTAVQNSITLFGLVIYTFKEENNFKMSEVEYENLELVQNLLLPFKMRKTIIYELEEHVIDSKFDDVKEEYIEKARLKALENVKNCDKIKEEFYTLRHLADMTVVDYCITTQELIGDTYDS